MEEGRRAGCQSGRDWGPVARLQTKPPPWQPTPAEAPTGTGWPGWLFLRRTSALGASAARSRPGCLVCLFLAQPHLGTRCRGLDYSGKFLLAKPRPTTQGLSAIQGSCTKNSGFKATGAPAVSSPLVPHQTDNQSGDLLKPPPAPPHLLLPPLSDWQAGAGVPGKNKESEEDPKV